MSLTTRMTKENHGFNWDKLVSDLRLSFVPIFCHFFIRFGCCVNFRRPKTCDESTFWMEKLCSAAGHIEPSSRL